MKKISVFLAAALCMLCLCPAALARAGARQVLSAADGNFAAALPDDFRILHEEDAREFQEGSPALDLARDAYLYEGGFGMREDERASVGLLYEAGAFPDDPSYSDMTDEEFAALLSDWRNQDYDIRILSADLFYAGEQRMMRYVFQDAKRYCINYRAVEGGGLYEMQYSWMPPFYDDVGYEEGLLEADAIAAGLLFGQDAQSAALKDGGQGRQSAAGTAQEGTELALPGTGFQAVLPKGYTVVLPGRVVSGDVPEETRAAVQSFADGFYINNVPYGVKNDLSAVVYLTCEPDAQSAVHEEGGDGYAADYRGMTDGEFADMMWDMTRSPRPSYINMQNVDEFWATGLRFMRYCYNQFYISYRTVVDGAEYTLHYEKQDVDVRADFAEFLPEADAIALSATLDEGVVPAPDAAGSKAALPGRVVTVAQANLAFEVPGHFYGIRAGDSLDEIPREYRPVFAAVKPLMEEAGVFYYALRMDTSLMWDDDVHGAQPPRIGQMAVYGRGVPDGALREIFDRGDEALLALEPSRTDRAGGGSTQEDGIVTAGDVIFDKTYLDAGGYTWMKCAAQDADIPLVFAYASDGGVVTAAAEDDVREVIQSFRMTLPDGREVPQDLTPEELTERMQQDYYRRLLCFVLACIAGLAALLAVQYFLHRRAAANPREYYRRAVIRRLRELERAHVLSGRDVLEKERELRR